MYALGDNLLISYVHFWQDSFEGLPYESPYVNLFGGDTYKWLLAREWRKGTYNAADILGQHSLAELRRQIIGYINSSWPVALVAGFYDRSLTTELAATCRGALFVDIDCDLYSSTVC